MNARAGAPIRQREALPPEHRAEQLRHREKLEAWLEARREDHVVEVLHAVAETYAVLFERFDRPRVAVDHADLAAPDLRDRALVEGGDASGVGQLRHRSALGLADAVAREVDGEETRQPIARGDGALELGRAPADAVRRRRLLLRQRAEQPEHAEQDLHAPDRDEVARPAHPHRDGARAALDEIERDLRGRVAAADDEHRAPGEGLRVPVRGAVEDAPAEARAARELGLVRHAVDRGRDRETTRAEQTARRVELPLAARI